MLNVTGQGKDVPVIHETLDHEGKWWGVATALHILNVSARWTEVVSYMSWPLYPG